MKRTHHIALISLCIAILASGCGGSGSSSPSSSTPVASKVSINATNADAVAKGAMTPSQSVAKTGSGAAGAVGVVIEPGAPKQSVMSIALAQLKRVEGIKLPASSSGVTGVSIAPFPITFGCGIYSTTSTINGGTVNPAYGTMTLDLQDANINATFDAGDVAILAFSSCVEPNPAKAGATTTTNGSMSLAIDSQNGVGTTLSPLNESVSMSFNSFSIVDTAPTTPETITLNGGMTLATVNDGATLTSTMTGLSFGMTSSTDGVYTLKDFSISYSDDSVSATPTGAYSFSVNMTTNCAALNGDIVITTTTPFAAGTATGNPTVGVMTISGANNSSLTLTANANDTVTITVNDGTGGAQPAPKTVTWDQI